VARDSRIRLARLLPVPSRFEPNKAGHPLDRLPELYTGDKHKESERAKGSGEGEQKEEGATHPRRGREAERVTPDEDTHDSIQSQDPSGEEDSLPSYQSGKKPSNKPDERDITTVMIIVMM
jgi:hypothetical protein